VAEKSEQLAGQAFSNKRAQEDIEHITVERFKPAEKSTKAVLQKL
jgi:hypothetical protein